MSEIKEKIDRENLPKHVGIIMDGNGRWAEARGKKRVYGHKAGAKAVRAVVEASREIGISYLTLYAFSNENWNRPSQEKKALWRLLKKFLKDELPNMLENKIRLKVIGRVDMLPPGVQGRIIDAEAETEKCQEMTLIIALSYGGRQEIVDAVKRIIKQKNIEPQQITEELIQSYLYLPECPDADLIIRTSGEQRISGFLLWQCSYAEFIFTDTLWPDFGKEEFFQAIYEFQQRNRRFGKVDS